MGEITSTLGVLILFFAIFVSIGLAAYHFLIFDNVQGFFEDLDFYNPDDQSQHYLYWFFFWSIVLFSGVGARAAQQNK